MSKSKKKSYQKGKQVGSRKGYAAGKAHATSSKQQPQGYKFGVDDVVGFAVMGPIYQMGKWFVTG